MEELEKMSLVELRLYGRKLGMKNATTFKKQELIGEIQKILAAQNTPARERTEGVSGTRKRKLLQKPGKELSAGEQQSKRAERIIQKKLLARRQRHRVFRLQGRERHAV